MRLDARGVKIFRRDFASSYGWWGNMAIVLGRQPPEPEHVTNYRACIVELHQQFPQGIGLITVVNETSAPGPAGRDAIIQTIKEVWPRLTATLFVPNAEGFKAAVMRSVMGGLILATGQRDRIRVESSLSAALPWFAARVLGRDAASQLDLLESGVERFCVEESSCVSNAR